MNKQIEEMANIIHDADAKIIYNMVKAQPEDFVGRALPRQVYVAKELYAMGYRKASDVAEKIFVEIAKLVQIYLNDADYSFGEFALDIANLQEKFKNEGANDEQAN